MSRAKDQFGASDIEGALETLRRAGDARDAVVLRKKIEKFARIYEGALNEHRAKRVREAIRELKQAKAFEAKITGGRSRVADEINRKLADMHYVQGMGAYLEERYPESYRAFKTATSYAPDHRMSRQQLDELALKAKDAFEAGYRAKDSNPDTAREKWKLVLQIVPSSNEYYRKAKQWLDSLK